MRTHSIALVLAFGLASCVPAVGRAPRDPLDEPWLGDTPTIRAAHLATIMELGRSDPEVVALFGEATRALGGSLDALAAHMSICPDEVQEGGLTLVQSYDAVWPRSIEEIANGSHSPKADAWLSDLHLRVFAMQRTEDVDSVHFEIALVPKICFVRRLTIGQAYEAVVHELVHATYWDPREFTKFAVAASDETAFLRSIVLAKGGEVAAYTFATRARRRIPGGHFTSPLNQVIDIRGPTPVAPEAIADAILAPAPRGLGYAGGLYRGKYATTLQTVRKELTGERALFAKVLEERQQQADDYAKRIEVGEHNVGIFEHNIGVAKARHDAALLARTERQYAETKADIAHSKAIADISTASIPRLNARLSDLDARIAALPPIP